VLIIALVILYLKPLSAKWIKIFLAFSGAYLLGISFTHLLPEVYHHGDALKMGSIVLVGFIFQLFLDFFSDGIEHAHVHVHDHSKKFPMAMMLSLSIHAFVEGIPLEREIHNSAFHHHAHSDHSLLFGIIFHNIPVTVALAAYFLQSGFTKKSALFFIGIFSLMGPLGAFLSHQFGNDFVETFSGFFEYSLAFVVGMFLHISTTILFESSEGHKFNAAKLSAIIIGFVLAMVAI
jgi:zinc transporter ZupT